jgi:hypothetical protein
MIVVSIPMFMYGLGFISGMIFVWAFGIAHDLIINWYREAIYNRELAKEKKVLEAREKSENTGKKPE